MSTNHTTYPTSGFASFTAIAGLGNPRGIHKSKTLIFDAQLYVGPEHLLLGSLHYFNTSNIEFEDTVRLYFVYVTFARNQIGTEVYPSMNRNAVDYDLVGDIQWMSDIGPPQPLYSAPTLNTIAAEPTVSIDSARPPFLHIVGVAADCKKETETTPKPITSFFCRFPDSPKYKEGKYPMPVNRRYVTITGFLSDVKYVNDIEVDGVEHFIIDIETIVFTGWYTPPASTQSTQSSTVTKAHTKGKALFSYSTSPPPPSPEASTQSTSSPSKKRARAD
ncbi:hypothetical protein BJ912DRAFT_920518 [Pholiota molesta]|nr:hypothetical protein BJ912DRAFT_920518 [Pholiota molesta]